MRRTDLNLRRLQRTLGLRLVTRHRMRTVFLILACALPIMIAVALASIASTATVTDDEAQSMAMGQAQARLTEVRHTDVTALLRTAGRGIPDQTYSGMPLRTIDGRQTRAKGRAIDLTDPLAAGMFVTRTGNVRSGSGTIAVSVGLASAMHVKVGDTILVGPQQRPLTVSAVLAYPRVVSDVFFVLPSPIPVGGAGRADIVGTRNWLVSGMVDTDVAKQAGVEVSERKTIVASEGSGPAQGLSLALAVGLLAECLLVISAAVTVIARSQSRTASLLASMGAPSRFQWGFLTQYIKLITAVAVIAGTGSGIVVAALLVHPLQDRSDADWGAFTPAWAVAAAIVLITVVAVRVVAAGPVRRMRRAALLDLLLDLPATHQPTNGRQRLVAAALVIVGGIAVWAASRDTNWSPALAVGGAVLTGTGLAFLAVLAIHGLVRRPMLGGPMAWGLALRHLTASTNRALLTVAALTALASLGTFLQVGAQMTVASAERNRSTPTIEGWSLLDAGRELTRDERRALPGPVYSFASAISGPDAGQVAPATDALQCIAKTAVFAADGHVDTGRCAELSRSKNPFPLVAVAESDDAAVLARRPLAPAESAAYTRGDLAVISGPAGTPSPVQLVTREVIDAKMRLTAVGRIDVREGPDASSLTQMPTLYLSPAAARRLHLREMSTRYLVNSRQQERIHSTLPADIAPFATIMTNEDSPLLAPAKAMKTLSGIVAAVTSAAVLACMLVLWAGDLAHARQTGNALGMHRRRQRTTGAMLALILAGIGTLSGTTLGQTAAGVFTSASGFGIQLTWAPLITACVTLFGAAVVGAATVPKGVNTHRQP